MVALPNPQHHAAGQHSWVGKAQRLRRLDDSGTLPTALYTVAAWF